MVVLRRKEDFLIYVMRTSRLDTIYVKAQYLITFSIILKYPLIFYPLRIFYVFLQLIYYESINLNLNKVKIEKHTSYLLISSLDFTLNTY